MSLAVAVRWGVGHFEIAADGLVIQHSGSMAQSAVKTWRIGGWVAGWVGALNVAQAFIDACEHIPAVEIADILRGAYRVVIDEHGSKRDDGTRFLDLDVLAIGKGGTMILRGSGSLMDVSGQIAVIGCAEEYAIGLVDGWARPLVEGDSAVIVSRAMKRYPGVGGEISMLGALGTEIPTRGP